MKHATANPVMPVHPNDVPAVINALSSALGGDVVLASYMGVSPMSVYQWKNNIHVPSAPARMLMGHIAKQYGIRRNTVTVEASDPAGYSGRTTSSEE